ncbi:MAG: heparan-alpha-glucosaminide N-acetyltransferase domain-containing protein [Mucilaginibacter sp.]
MNQFVLQKHRIQSIDIVRGLIMLIMTLDHTRDFFHFQGPQYNPTNMATTTVLLFFTRWITHYCAPVFVFLSGVSACLAGQRRTKSELSMFLIKRGLWLMLMDVVVITFMFTLNPGFNAIVLEVLWAIGFSMVILGLLVRAPLVVIGVIGGIIFFGHNLLDLGIVQQPKPGVGSNLLTIFFTAPGVIQLGSTHMVLDAYAVIPWTGVMMLGYVFGSLYKKDADVQRRKKTLLVTGLCSIAFFILLRYINHYGDPAPWGPQRNVAHTLLSFLNTTKYPPSLLFLCMTLGPALILLSVIEGIQNKLTAFCMVYGNVPFFYFLAHLYLLRAINLILIFASGISTKDSGSPFMFQPPKFGYPLWTVYLIWAGVIGILYFPCRWFARYKKSHQQWWLSYL